MSEGTSKRLKLNSLRTYKASLLEKGHNQIAEQVQELIDSLEAEGDGL